MAGVPLCMFREILVAQSKHMHSWWLLVAADLQFSVNTIMENTASDVGSSDYVPRADREQMSAKHGEDGAGKNWL